MSTQSTNFTLLITKPYLLVHSHIVLIWSVMVLVPALFVPCVPPHKGHLDLLVQDTTWSPLSQYIERHMFTQQDSDPHHKWPVASSFGQANCTMEQLLFLFTNMSTISSFAGTDTIHSWFTKPVKQGQTCFFFIAWINLTNSVPIEILTLRSCGSWQWQPPGQWEVCSKSQDYPSWGWCSLLPSPCLQRDDVHQKKNKRVSLNCGGRHQLLGNKWNCDRVNPQSGGGGGGGGVPISAQLSSWNFQTIDIVTCHLVGGESNGLGSNT